LNIFTPGVVRLCGQLKFKFQYTFPVKKYSSTSGGAFPVMVFFHGGNFQTGSANDWPGHILASRGIVVVNVNYRLGPFGWLQRLF
jgi:acetyl esterase/lipase